LIGADHTFGDKVRDRDSVALPLEACGTSSWTVNMPEAPSRCAGIDANPLDRIHLQWNCVNFLVLLRSTAPRSTSWLREDATPGLVAHIWPWSQIVSSWPVPGDKGWTDPADAILYKTPVFLLLLRFCGLFFLFLAY